MKISIVTSVFNGASTIEQTMQSVQSQTFADTEHVIVDGQSKDDTVAIVQRNLREQDQFVSEPDEGIYDAMNKGLRMATGDVVGIIGSDDFYAGADIFSHIAAAFEDDSQPDAIYGDLAYVRGDSEDIARFWKSGEYKSGSFTTGWVPPHPTFFCKRELFETFGDFRLDLPVAADFELLLRFIVKNKISVKYLAKTITVMRLGGTLSLIHI